jgi:hypothetical protein
MANDSFPSNDGEFDLFQAQFIGTVAASPAKYGLLPQDVAALQADQATWQKAFAGHGKAQDDARTATQGKETARGKLEVLLRGMARKVHGSVGDDNALRVAAGLKPREGTRSSIGAPTTRPLGRIEVKANRTLVVHFVDEETPTRLAKPQGVQGCQVWSFVGEAKPADASAYAFLALDTRTPYADEHHPENAGKTAYYLLRWQNAKGETGPWSDVVSMIVPV